MKKMIFVARRDDKNPYAIEEKLTLESRENGQVDNIKVVLVNVPHKNMILDGVRQIYDNIIEGKIEATEETRVAVFHLLVLLTNKTYHYTPSNEIIEFIAEKTGFHWLKPWYTIGVEDDQE